MHKQTSMKQGCIYINNTLFTENNVPFQLSDDEDIFYFHRSAQFYLRIGNGVPIETEVFKSSDGLVFLTTYRLIYKVTHSENNFTSFCLPLRDVVAVSDNGTVDFIYGSFLQSIYLDFGDAQKTVFFKVLQGLLQSFNGSSLNDNDDFLPFYSDLYK